MFELCCFISGGVFAIYRSSSFAVAFDNMHNLFDVVYCYLCIFLYIGSGLVLLVMLFAA